MIKRAIIALTLIVTGSFGMAFVSTQPALAGVCDERGRVITLKPWFYNLTSGDSCDLKSPSEAGGFGPYIWQIALNLIEDLFQIRLYCSRIYHIRRFPIYHQLRIARSGGSWTKNGF